jgi:hypothetical protein
MKARGNQPTGLHQFGTLIVWELQTVPERHMRRFLAHALRKCPKWMEKGTIGSPSALRERPVRAAPASTANRWPAGVGLMAARGWIGERLTGQCRTQFAQRVGVAALSWPFSSRWTQSLATPMPVSSQAMMRSLTGND